MAQIIFWVLSSHNTFAQGTPQLTLGDSVSIYSEKAYRRENGTLFEAVGNVIIISGKETLYGEKASLNSKTGDVLLEGSVRFIGDNITLYGSRIEMNVNTQALLVKNARMITPEFSIVASLIQKKSEKNYYAKNAEFTTCTDCAASWLLSGDEIFVELEQYVQVHHALAKIKGIDVLYLPYIAIPLKDKRESGLLFPNIYTREIEGFVYGQPFYWAIDDSRDATITPTSFGQRGYGTDVEYRQILGEKKWFEFSSKVLSDAIYVPGEKNTEPTSDRRSRYFTKFESHMQYSNDWTQHFLVTATSDLDFLRDFREETNDSIADTDLGAEFFLEKRFEKYNFSLESELKRNILVAEPTEVDKSYVQVLPSLSFSMMPTIAFQNDQTFLSKISYGFESRFTTFKQLEQSDDDTYLRNANRIEAYPYVDVNWVNFGPLNLSSQVALDYQEYNFFEDDEVNFSKNATVISTEMSFTFDRIFGLAYEEVYQTEEFREKDLIKFNSKSGNDLNKVDKANSTTIGKLPDFEDSLAKETLTVKRNSYRHSQEFKFLHHKILGSSENGNQRFLTQIETEEGWFDNNDIIKARLDSALSNETRMVIPKNNTFELQWNNSLIKKTPKNYGYLTDEKYLKDTFEYQKIGYFNISQGIFIDSGSSDLDDRLTRLFLDTYYSGVGWNVSLTDYYFHKESDHILTFSGEKKFEKISALSIYTLNSLSTSNIETLKAGFQFRPHDVIGLSYLEEYDFNAREKISTIYQADLMPYNNCWFFNFRYRDNIEEKRFTLDFVFNFGSSETSAFRSNYFNFNRL